MWVPSVRIVHRSVPSTSSASSDTPPDRSSLQTFLITGSCQSDLGHYENAQFSKRAICFGRAQKTMRILSSPATYVAGGHRSLFFSGARGAEIASMAKYVNSQVSGSHPSLSRSLSRTQAFQAAVAANGVLTMRIDTNVVGERDQEHGAKNVQLRQSSCSLQ